MHIEEQMARDVIEVVWFVLFQLLTFPLQLLIFAISLESLLRYEKESKLWTLSIPESK